MNDYPRLIEHAFPLRQASIDSMHEKNVRHGHISTLHIWPARRPLAAARAALLATLLRDPGTPEGRKELCEKIGGKLTTETDKEGRVKEITDGGILRWKRETESKPLFDWFRQEIRKDNGGSPPKVLDPFSGGGSIPLEAMRLGCDVTAADLNPVAWFILKCTLEYPQKLAGQTRPLPDFILRDRDFMEDFLKEVKGIKGAKLRKTLATLGHLAPSGEHQQDEWDFEQAAASAGVTLDADIAWHVRAWGCKVLAEARKELAHLYPTYVEWQPLVAAKAFDPRPMQLIEPDGNGVLNTDKLNAELSEAYLQDRTNPRWIAKPTVAYLWARTVTCKNCRAKIPLLKTLWLCKAEGKRIRLVVEAKKDQTGPAFSIEENVPERGGNAAQKREHDKKVGGGTMSRAGAQCLCCPAIMDMDDIRYAARNGALGEVITAVVLDGPSGKEYRLPTQLEREIVPVSFEELQKAFAGLCCGDLSEPMAPASTRSISVQGYDIRTQADLYTGRQRVGLACLGRLIKELPGYSDSNMGKEWREPIQAYLLTTLGKLIEHCTALCSWNVPNEQIRSIYARFSLAYTWDYCEVAVTADRCGSFASMLDSTVSACHSLARMVDQSLIAPKIELESATTLRGQGTIDVIITDPPYYEAISYADLSDVFYVWFRRVLKGQYEREFSAELTDKVREIVQHVHPDKSRVTEKNKYEQMMSDAFTCMWKALTPRGRAVVVFAHKKPDAWETLVSALIRAGFVVTASWPIQTERAARARGIATAALASSVWLVCRKRDPLVKAGWDNRVMTEMRDNIASQLREFWDAGIRGPDFVWAATGPAMEAYSKYPAVKKANSPTNEFLSVKDFLDAVRRIVIEFVVGRVLHIESGTDRLDSVTSYYLLHRNDFGFEKAPAGACILYAVSCGLSDAELERTWNLVKVKGSAIPESEEVDEEGDDETDEPTEEMSGGEFILRTWKERKEKRLGYESVGGREIPLIDRVHRLMHLWRDGDVRKVDDYLDEYALRQNELFGRLIQSLIELSEQTSEERALLESLSNHLGGKAAKADRTRSLGLDVET
jgi:putative DNA methylase